MGWQAMVWEGQTGALHEASQQPLRKRRRLGQGPGKSVVVTQKMMLVSVDWSTQQQSEVSLIAREAEVFSMTAK